MDTASAQRRYRSLKKPSWAPPAWVFGPVWTVLYAVIFASYGYVYMVFLRGEIPTLVFVPFVLNLVFNFAFTFIQFGLKSNLLATLDTVLVLVTLTWALAAIILFVPWVAYVNIPYFLWTCFAVVLQLTVTVLNWPKPKPQSRLKSRPNGRMKRKR